LPETAGGREVWRKSLPNDFGGKKGDGWGYSDPFSSKATRRFARLAADTTLVAFEKLTGKTLWTSSLPDKPGAGHARS